jgi:hypothetical protein
VLFRVTTIAISQDKRYKKYVIDNSAASLCLIRDVADILEKTKGDFPHYYSRSIKKKVLALANPDLHKLASKL